MTTEILLAKSDDEIRACYAVMAELRPHVPADQFVDRVRRQMEIADYELVCLTVANEVKAVAGIRISENLAWGNFLYVDDLVSKSDERSQGSGGALFDWLVSYARDAGCDQFHLDSNVQRFGSHRFYLARRMNIEAHHFGLKLRD